MIPKSHTKLFEKSRNYRNEQAIKKIVDKEDMVSWSKTENPAPINYTPPKVEPLTAGIYNLVRQMLP